VLTHAIPLQGARPRSLRRTSSRGTCPLPCRQEVQSPWRRGIESGEAPWILEGLCDDGEECVKGRGAFPPPRGVGRGGGSPPPRAPQRGARNRHLRRPAPGPEPIACRRRQGTTMVVRWRGMLLHPPYSLQATPSLFRDAIGRSPPPPLPLWGRGPALDGWAVPCDAAIVGGTCLMDESGLTGESMPQQKVALPTEARGPARPPPSRCLPPGQQTVGGRGHERITAISLGVCQCQWFQISIFSPQWFGPWHPLDLLYGGR